MTTFELFCLTLRNALTSAMGSDVLSETVKRRAVLLQSSNMLIALDQLDYSSPLFVNTPTEAYAAFERGMDVIHTVESVLSK